MALKQITSYHKKEDVGEFNSWNYSGYRLTVQISGSAQGGRTVSLSIKFRDSFDPITGGFNITDMQVGFNPNFTGSFSYGGSTSSSGTISGRKDVWSWKSLNPSNLKLANGATSTWDYPIIVQGVATGFKLECVATKYGPFKVRYYDDGKLIHEESVPYYGSYIVWAPPSSGPIISTGSYNITWNDKLNSNIHEEYAWSQTTTKTFRDWNAGEKPGNRHTGVTQDQKFIANWNINTQPTIYSKLNRPQSPTTKGYKFNGWFTSNSGGTLAPYGSDVTASTTYYAQYTPKQYRVSYSLDSGANFVGSERPQPIMKTYGVSTNITNIECEKYGYKFIGWKTEYNSNYIAPGGLLDDRFTDDATPVTLIPAWEPINHTLKFHYYVGDVEHIDTKVINIESAFYSKSEPDNPRTGDWVLLGWKSLKAIDQETTDKNIAEWRRTKGEYIENVEDATDYVLPLSIDPSNHTIIWQEGTIEDYYGLWTITGKYIKINNIWKKVSLVYVNVDGEWKPIQRTYVNKDGQWNYIKGQDK